MSGFEKMKIIDTQERICPCCMARHEVKRVSYEVNVTYKGIPVKYNEESFYCDNAGEWFVEEDMMSKNYKAMIDAYSGPP
ncbi:MAG: hypothetical protein IJS22_03395 [Lachnospiraceae bacterium]|nr:hypothetical protein [Lachnospiraceae bacterium]